MIALKLWSRVSGNSEMIRRLALLAMAIALGTALCAARASADSAPDWLRALAREKLPDYPADTIAVELIDELQTTVQDNGEIDSRHRIAYRLLRPEAKDRYGYAAVPFDNQTKIASFNAWTIAPDGHEFAVKDKDSSRQIRAASSATSTSKSSALSFLRTPGSFKTKFRCGMDVLSCNSLPVGSTPRSGSIIPSKSLKSPAISMFGKSTMCRPLKLSLPCPRGRPLRGGLD
jgi:Domain of Unknown Function with PDB structure (DUF3857)